jgi:hypothetical protein
MRLVLRRQTDDEAGRGRMLVRSFPAVVSLEVKASRVTL